MYNTSSANSRSIQDREALYSTYPSHIQELFKLGKLRDSDKEKLTQDRIDALSSEAIQLRFLLGTIDLDFVTNPRLQDFINRHNMFDLVNETGRIGSIGKYRDSNDPRNTIPHTQMTKNRALELSQNQ